MIPRKNFSQGIAQRSAFTPKSDINSRYSPNWPWKGAAGPDRVDVAVR